MTLLQKRIEFAEDMGRLLSWASLLDYQVIVDQVRRGKHEAEWNSNHCRVVIDGKRCERTKPEHGVGWLNAHYFKPIGIKNSVHNSGLAVDLYVITDGEISSDLQLYENLATLWKSMRDENRWGGDFEGFKDLGHFSREHLGRS